MMKEMQDMKDGDVKEEPDFIETHCHWIGCDRDFGTQDQLVKVRRTNSVIHWIDLANRIIMGTRQEFFRCVRVNNYKIGLGSMVNQFHSLNGKILITSLNDSYPTYKYKCKNVFKPYEMQIDRPSV